jgi:hypothetical protein
MRNTWDFFCRTLRATPTGLHWVGGVCLAILLFKIVSLNQIPEQFPHAHELGLLSENLLAAIVAAYIFFVISYQLPLVLERQAVGPSIAMLADQVVNSVVTFVYEVNFHLNARHGTATLPTPVTEKLITDLFSRISPNAPSPVWQRRTLAVMSWFDVLIDHDLECREHID